jgi:hypothetical protein
MIEALDPLSVGIEREEREVALLVGSSSRGKWIRAPRETHRACWIAFMGST